MSMSDNDGFGFIFDNVFVFDVFGNALMAVDGYDV
jgi:hypothetical protein